MNKKNLINFGYVFSCLLVVLSLTGCPKPQYPNCKTDDQCKVTVDGVEHHGMCVFGKCQECVKNSDCSDDQVCHDGACVMTCDSNSDCPNGTACMSGKCLRGSSSCEGPADCEAGYGCVNGTCVYGASGMTACANNSNPQMVFFDFDKSVIKPAGVEVLNSLAMCLKDESNTGLTVEGHTDNRGTVEYNLSLGERRAQAVVKYLQSMGISADRIKTISYGSEMPLVDENNEESWAKNRRAVVRPGK